MPNDLQPLTIQTAAPGGLDKINEMIADCALDVIERPGEERARTVTVVVKVWPDADRDYLPRVQMSCKATTPGYVSGKRLGVIQDGEVWVNAQEPDARQMTLVEMGFPYSVAEGVPAAAEAVNTLAFPARTEAARGEE